MKGPSGGVYTVLVNQGPKPATDIDSNSITVEQREDGLRKFHPRASSLGTVKHGGPMQKTPVYYIHEKHTPEAVIQTWIDANRKTVESVGKRAIHWRICEYGEDWKKASREIIGPFPEFDRETGGETNIEECPMCQTKIKMSLASHLPECPEA